ncbi:MAG: anthrone oxygenase family protein [Pseudomonadota bacterium]
MTAYSFVLFSAAFLCSLVAGFLFAFAAVVMPALHKMNDRDFIHSFQAIDGVIQRRQPLFIFVWLGSVISIVILVVFGALAPDTQNQGLIGVATFAYLGGVQLPTFTINIPLNNRIQSFALDGASETEQQLLREQFERKWNRSNICRTAVACIVSGVLVMIAIDL